MLQAPHLFIDDLQSQHHMAQQAAGMGVVYAHVVFELIDFTQVMKQSPGDKQVAIQNG